METTQEEQSPGAERLLHAARRLFAQHGFAGASMRAIADKARCNVALAYHHFGSKEGLYEALFAGFADRLARAAGKMEFSATGGSVERVERVLDGVLTVLIQEEELVRILVRESMAPSAVYFRLGRAHMQRVLETAELALSTLAEAKGIHGVHSRELLILIYGMLMHTVAARAGMTRALGSDPLRDPALSRLRSEVKSLIIARLGLTSPAPAA